LAPNSETGEVVMAIKSLRGRVRWFETDAAGVAHFTAFQVYCEDLEKAFLYSEDVGFKDIEEKYNIWIPRVRVECKYMYPLRFNEEYRVDLVDIRLGNTSIEFRYRIWNVEAGKLSAECTMTIVCVDKLSNKPVRIPDKLKERLNKAIKRGKTEDTVN
jgi:YbgC/YbaW family acyl-CoA thioester hydrolase